jgi:hypothetical protein
MRFHPDESKFGKLATADNNSIKLIWRSLASNAARLFQIAYAER